MDVLIRIKRAVLAGQYAFSEKARIEMETDDLTELDVAESILNAVAIYKRLRVEFYECPDCGERIYDPAAVRHIEQHSHMTVRRRPVRRIA